MSLFPKYIAGSNGYSFEFGLANFQSRREVVKLEKYLLMNKWNGLSFEPDNYNTIGDIALLNTIKEAQYDYDFAEDFSKYECIAFDIKLEVNRIIELELAVYPLVIGRPEYIEKANVVVTVVGESDDFKTVEIAFSQFNYAHAAAAFWRYISKVGISTKFLSTGQDTQIPIKNIRLKHKGVIHLSSPVYSKPGKTFDEVEYKFTTRNISNNPQAISIDIEKYGWEAMESRIEDGKFLLNPGESKECILRVKITESIAPGGQETQKIVVVPNGDINFAKDIQFITLRELPHPYIIHTDKGFSELNEKAEKYSWAKEALQNYISRAENFEVPEVHGGSYLFETMQRKNIKAAAIAWKLTGRIEFAQKVALFLKRLSDPVKGYKSTETPFFVIIESKSDYDKTCPMQHMVCNQGLIQEAEIFRDIAQSYDVIHDCGVLTELDHKNIKETFRAYIEFMDFVITNGDCNNFQVGEMTAALFCSMAIQDYKWMKRFLYGYNGFVDLLASVQMDDGWYFEMATGYVLLGTRLFSEVVQAALPWGINLRDMYVQPKYNKNVLLSSWSMKKEKPFLGMSFEKYGPNSSNYRSVRRFFDVMLPFVNSEGILFSSNDSPEKKINHAYDVAYYIFRDPSYAAVINREGERNFLYSIPDLPEVSSSSFNISACSDNAGLAVLRSQTAQRETKNQIQTVLKYGTHGGYHGHFDRISLLSIMRYGKSFYNTEATWYGYDSYLFKMWVQTSLAHNMVVVDQRMQEPKEAKKLMFSTGKMIQACAVETTATWCDPAYGGQTPYPEVFPEEKSLKEKRYLPPTKIRREQGSTGEYSEPVLQRRMVVVTDDYIVVADYLKSEEEHEFDSLYHIKGYCGMEAENKKLLKHTGQFNQDPYGAGQFITNCDWYEVSSPSVLHFEEVYSFKDKADELLKLNLHPLWPQKSEIMIGNFPENQDNNKILKYEVLGDKRTLTKGEFGSWILGKGVIELSMDGIQKLEIKVSVEIAPNKKKTVFIGNPYFITSKGEKLYLADLELEYENVDSGYGIGKDYYGGPVLIVGEKYEKAISFEPIDQKLQSVITVDLKELDVVAFKAVIGGSYPLGKARQQRKTVSQHFKGKGCSFLTIIEPFDEESVIKKAKAINENTLVVELKDGRRQEIKIINFKGDGSDISATIEEI